MMITSLLLSYLFAIVTGQSPPLQTGDTNQYILVKLNTDLNLTCPFNDVQFYKWNNIKSPTPSLSEHKELKIRVTSFTKSDVYECEAVNGYGKRTAIFVVKGIDINSKQFDIDCQSREIGPCFLVSGVSNDFDYSIEENSKIAMDCRAVMISNNKGSLTYNWKKMSSPDSFEMKLQNSLTNKGTPFSGKFLDDVKPIGRIEYNTIDDMSKWGSIVVFDKVTKDIDGVYQCAVSNSVSTIRRTFRLRVKENQIITTIEGPLNQHIRTTVGSTETLHCKALSKPKWGKKLDSKEESSESTEIITWGGSRYKMLHGSLDNELKENGGSVKDSKYYTNNLKLENIQPSHAGVYVCTVLTSSTLEHKYVNLSVEAGPGFSETLKKHNNFPIYIAVPTTVFIICLGIVLYCLIRRRTRQKANFKNRAARGAVMTTTNSSSGNGSCSGSRNTTNPRLHMLTTTTCSSKGSQIQYNPNNCFTGNITSVPLYGANHAPFSSGYTPAVMSYNYSGTGPYIQATNNTPCGTELEHPCGHHNCMPYNNHPVPYDSDSTPSPPPPTSVTDTISTSAIMPGTHNGLVPYSSIGGSGSSGLVVNSYSPNQSSQIYMPNQTTSHGSSSTSVSMPNTNYPINQPAYPVGVIYSA